MKNNNFEKEYFEKFGYESFGPILLNFSKWLYNQCKKKNIKKIYFLSRDGYILKRAFDSLNYDDVETFYLYASRRAVIVPSLNKLKNTADIFNSITFGNKIKMKYFIKKVGLEDIDLSSIISKYNINVNDELDTENFKIKYHQFLEEIFPIIVKNSKEEEKNMHSYLENNKFNGKVAIVDIGWYGTMQEALDKINDDTEIHGFYLGVYPYKKFKNPNRINGFIFSHDHDQNLYEKFRNFIQIFEFMTLARDGSLKRYLKSNKLEFYEYEYKNKKESIYTDYLQESAIRYVVDNQDQQQNDNKKSVEKLINVCTKPKIIDVKVIGNINFMDNETKKLVSYEGIKKYIFSPKKLIKDLNSSIWKIGFLKLLFKIDLPYTYMVNCLRKQKNKKEEL